VKAGEVLWTITKAVVLMKKGGGLAVSADGLSKVITAILRSRLQDVIHVCICAKTEAAAITGLRIHQGERMKR
jgi:hypothetical protein